MTRASRFIVDHYLALPVGAAIALAWANLGPASYFAVAERAAFAVNDIAMTVFFAMMTREVIEATRPDGTLHTWRRFALALAAAAGGVGGATAAYFGCLRATDEGSLLAAGWPVVCATDIACSYCIARNVCHARALPFLVLVGMASNAIALSVLEVRHPIHDLQSAGVVLMMAGVVSAVVMRRCDVRNVWLYVIAAGGLTWAGLFSFGLHPALALVPIVATLPQSSRRAHRLDHALTTPTHVVLFFFGLVNAGVIARGAGTGTYAVAFAVLIGKPLGMLTALAIATSVGLRLPRFVGWRDMIVLTIASSIGFTFALFSATLAYPVGPVLGEIKLGALTTVAAAAAAIAAARLLRIGRFAQRRERSPRIVEAEHAGV